MDFVETGGLNPGLTAERVQPSWSKLADSNG